MPLLEIVTSKKITAIVTLEDSTVRRVDKYAAYTKKSADEVVNAALEYVFSRDKDFLKFCDEHASAEPSAALRIKRAASSGTTSSAGKKGSASTPPGAR